MAALATAILRAVLAGGPLVLLLYLLIVLAIPAAALLAWRRVHPAACYTAALLPIAFGSLAAWLSLHAADLMLNSLSCGEAIPSAIHSAQQSLITGWLASLLALAAVLAIGKLRGSPQSERVL